MVELRKRQAAPPAPPPAKRKTSEKKAVPKAETKPDEVSKKTEKPNAAPPQKGDTASLVGFGGTIQLNDGTSTTLKELIDASKAGVVIFTYPKASTPGCTKQACLFRDAYADLTSTGFAIYGLSTDSPKSNTTFVTKQNLPYSLLCDTDSSLIGALGLKKPPKSTTRAVVIFGKNGKVLESMAGGPDATFEAAKAVIVK